MRKHTIFAFAAAVFLLAGCQAARMPVPPALSASERLAVQGRQGLKIREHVRFGPYEAVEIDRSWTRGSDLQVQAYEGNRRKQQYTFVLREGDASRWHVSCEAFLRKHTIRTKVVDVELEDRSALDCDIRAAGDASGAWTLALAENQERPLEGDLTNGDERLRVRGTRRLQKGLPAETTTGYEVLAAGRAVAAVEVINAGAVWLDASAARERQGLLSATAAALLLLEDLRAHLPDDRMARH